MKRQHPAWLVFYGTLTTIVRARDEAGAYHAFVAAGWPDSDDGRVVPPTRVEVTIRRPRRADRHWIEDSGDPAFLALLPELASR